MTVKLPKPGLYPGTKGEEVARWPAASATRLKIVRQKTPLHAHWDRLNPKEQTPAMTFGEAFHLAVLEPERFPELVVEGLDVDRRSKANQAKWAVFEEEQAGKIILKPSQYEELEQMREAVKRHAGLMELLDAPGHKEVAAVWEDGTTGYPCKGVLDGIARWRKWNVGYDVKSCMNASTDASSRVCGDLGYDLQAAFYLSGLQALDPDADWRFFFVFVEKQGPWAIHLFEPDPVMLSEGEWKYQQALAQWADAERKQEWHAYGNQIDSIGLKPWAQVMEREWTDGDE